MSDTMRATIEEEVGSHPIILYIKGEKAMPVCGFSKRVVDIFHHLGVDFETRNVLESEDRLLTLKEFSGWPTTPQVFIRGELVGGCDITNELFESGELQRMIGSTNA